MGALRLKWIESYRGDEFANRTTRQLDITLPNEMVDSVRERPQSIEYPGESEVIREDLRALWARDQAVEMWLRIEWPKGTTGSSPGAVLSPDALRTPLAAKRSATQ